MSIETGCFKKPCLWTPPPNCCDVCDGDSPEAQELFDYAWEMVTEWLYDATCQQFPGCCPVETEPCPPCECMCGYCDCGPWGSIDLNGAFCYPICVTDEGLPCIEFAFPQEDGSTEIITPETLHPDTGVPIFTMRPDMQTLDFCAPFKTDECSGSWPAQDHCDPWTIRATIGCPPPKMLLMGAAKFACEMVKECLGEENCLPDGVRSITRRGLTMDVGSNLEETINFETGGTGIPVLDLALVRWGCKDQKPATHFDPLQKYDEMARRCWTYRGRLDPVPVSADGC